MKVMNFKKLAITVAIAALVGACSGMGLHEAQMAAPKGDAFSKALYAEYIKLSKEEYSEGDYADADLFAERAIAAANGKPTEPEAVNSREQTKAAAGALTAARARLVAAFGKGSRAGKPDASARAQAMYECWAQEQEENFQPDHIDACRIAFFTALALIEEPAAAAAPAPAAPAAKAAPKTFVVYFGYNGKALDAKANGVLKAAAAAAKQGKPLVVSVIGHTDLSGADRYNSKLSEARANVVAAALEKLGVSDKLLSIGSLGENQPAIKTADGAKEAGNRRVEITIRY
jgi:OOP family OmpA-OmpF porin